MMNPNWHYCSLGDAVFICDSLRKPINAHERNQRILGKPQDSLFPYYGATGQVGYIDGYLTDGEYVLLGEDGAPFLDAYAPKAYLIQGKSWVNNHAHILKSKSDNKFLCYYLNYFNYKNYVTGTTRLKLTQAEMKKIPVPCPSLTEQQRIVSKIEELFSELDNSVAALKQTKAQLSVYRQAVLKDAFDGTLSETWRSTHNIPTFEENRALLYGNNKKYKFQENISLSTLPEGWGWISLGEAVEKVEYGSSKKSEKQGRIPVVRMGNIQNGSINWDDLVYSNDESEISKYTLHKGDVLFNRTNSPELVGKTAIFRGERNAIFAGYLIRVNQRPSISPEYLTYYLNSYTAKKYGNLVKTDGVNQSNINGKKLCSYPFPLCSEIEQNFIVNTIEQRLTVLSKIESTIDKTLQQAESLRQSILKQAFEGKLV